MVILFYWLWLGVKNPGLLFLDYDPLDGLFARFRVGHFNGVDTRFLNIMFVIGISDVVDLADDFTILIDYLNIHFLSVSSPADVHRTIAWVREHHGY